MMKHSLIPLIIALLSTPISATADKAVWQDAKDLNRETTPEGVAFTALQGERHADSYQALTKPPVAIVSPLHINFANKHGVMLQREMSRHADTDSADTTRKTEPDSYDSISCGLAHGPDVPCIDLIRDVVFDFLPVQP